MNVLSLFSGIGGLDLGLERAGMRIVGHVEIDPFCQQVLAQHWPEEPQHDDVNTTPEWWMSQPRPRVGVVAGGIPCPGHSIAGRQLGPEDPRWGWPGFRGVLDVTEAPIAIIENSPNLVRTGLDVILRDLAGRGFDAWWIRVPAAAFGTPHLRWRLIVVAVHRGRIDFAWPELQSRTVTGYDGATWSVADPAGEGLALRPVQGSGHRGDPQGHPDALGTGRLAGAPHRHWDIEPDVGRVARRVPHRVDRVKALGNAVVPAVGEYVGLLVMAGIAAAVRRAA